MSKSNIVGWIILVPLGLLAFYWYLWILAYWGDYKPLLSLPEFYATLGFGLFVLGIVLVTKRGSK